MLLCDSYYKLQPVVWIMCEAVESIIVIAMITLFTIIPLYTHLMCVDQ